MGLARRSDREDVISRAPASGIRQRVRPRLVGSSRSDDALDSTQLDVLPVVLDESDRFDQQNPPDREELLPLEEAIPFHTDTVLAAVFGLVAATAFGLVAVFLVT